MPSDSNLRIRLAETADADAIEALLLEAARWVDALGVVMWEDGELERGPIKRAFKGLGVSQALLAWAASRTRALGRAALRLDCDADRAKLRRLYESCGFKLHSYRQAGPYYVSRYELFV